MNPRATAAKVLMKVIYNNQSLTQVLAQAKESTNSTEPALIKELCYGVLRWYFRLSPLLAKLLTRPIRNKDGDINCLLLIGLYQLLYLRIPDHAAVTETVNAARDLKKNWATGLINGVLRNLLRDKANLLTQLDAELSSHYAHPSWLIKAIKQAWPAHWEAILTTNNQHPPLCLRVNILQTTREAYLENLIQHGISATAHNFAPGALLLETPQDITQLPGFTSGQFSVQDSAAQLAAAILELAPGQRVLDACAAPGGKTAHLMESQPEIAELVALDKDSERLDKAKHNWQRLQLPERVKWQVANAIETDTWWDGQLFDRILLDAPCSGTGVIRRHSDIKLLRQPEDIQTLVAEQSALLTALWPLLKPGGILVYATCSILPQENAGVIAKFLQLEVAAKEKNIIAEWGIAQENGRQIITGEQNMDGFYYARLAKES